MQNSKAFLKPTHPLLGHPEKCGCTFETQKGSLGGGRFNMQTLNVIQNVTGPIQANHLHILKHPTVCLSYLILRDRLSRRKQSPEFIAAPKQALSPAGAGKMLFVAPSVITRFLPAPAAPASLRVVLAGQLSLSSMLGGVDVARVLLQHVGAPGV